MKFMIILFLLPTWMWGQKDSLRLRSFDELIIISNKKPVHDHTKPLGSVDEYLEKSLTIQMIKRGPYASEPFINGLSAERTLITINCMRVYGDCTDKMDPI